MSPNESDTLPSCGNLLSDISKPDMIFILEIKTEAILLSCLRISFKMPSILKRMAIWSSYGSKCMSDALLFIAWLIMPLISLIIGVESL